MMTSINQQLDKFSLGVIPNPLKLMPALMRPDKPFVMVNMLSFRKKATGDYAHLTGQEAYEQYAQSVQTAQAPLGSRLLWAGQAQQKVTMGSVPAFHSIALLEYASPKAFLQFVTKGGSNIKARGAGLAGQWLISSTTLQEGKLPDTSDEHVVLVELSGRMAGQEVQKMYRDIGAKTLWHGRCDRHILGSAVPRIEEVLVTWFPDRRALDQVVSGLKRSDQLQGMRPYMAYTASSMVDFLPDLS